jgi:hypothetical protein
VSLIVLSLQHDDASFLIPLISVEVSKLANMDPPDPPLSQMVIHPSRSDLSSTMLKKRNSASLEVQI